jgi:hypothetical protein
MRKLLLTLLTGIIAVSAHANLDDSIKQSIGRFGQPSYNSGPNGKVQWVFQNADVMTEMFHNNICIMFMAKTVEPLSDQQIERLIVGGSNVQSRLSDWTTLPDPKHAGETYLVAPDGKTFRRI